MFLFFRRGFQGVTKELLAAGAVPPQTLRGLRPQRLASQADACGRGFRSLPLHSNVVGNLRFPPQTPRGLRPQRLASQADACGRVFPFRFAPLKCGREPTVPPTNAPLPKCGGGVGEKEIESTPDFPGCFCFSAGVFRGLPRSCSPQARFRQSIQAVCQGDYTAA